MSTSGSGPDAGTDAGTAAGTRRGPGRRAAGPRRRVRGVVLVVLPPVVVLLAAFSSARSGADDTSASGGPVVAGSPDRVPLTTASLVCPSIDATTTQVGVATLADLATSADPGEVTARSGTDVTPVAAASGRVATAADDGTATVVTGTGALAPALLATRSVASPLAAVTCGTTTGEQWFTGVGAAAEHRSVLELVNPDGGTAVADVTVYAANGVVEVAALRGVAVPAGATATYDLSALVPRRGDLGLRVQVVRGRLGASVLDVEDPLGGASVVSDWLPPQPAPARSSVLLGLARGTGSRDLTVVNPGDDEVSVEIRVVSPRATFTPEGLAALRVPPGSVRSVDLATLLDDASRRGAVGLLLDASGPVAASLRQVTGKAAAAGATDPGDEPAPDLSLVAPVPPVDDPTGVVVPAGSARLLLAGGPADAQVTVTSLGADGAVLATRQVALVAGTAANLRLPQGTALVTLDPGGATVRAAALVQRPGVTVLPVTALDRTLLVPAVRPGLP